MLRNGNLLTDGHIYDNSEFLFNNSDGKPIRVKDILDSFASQIRKSKYKYNQIQECEYQ